MTKIAHRIKREEMEEHYYKVLKLYIKWYLKADYDVLMYSKFYNNHLKIQFTYVI